jgi:hypothetical protein
VLGLGRADDGAGAAEARFGAGEALGEAVDDRRQALVHGAVVGLQVLHVGGARVARADEGEDSRPGRLGGGDQRLEGVEAEQRVGGDRVGAEAGDGAPGGGRLAEQRLAVGLGGDRDVAALAVGDDQQPGLAGRGADAFERRPARRAEPLEAGELRLDRDAGRPGPLDQRPAVGGDGTRGDFAGRALDGRA